MNKEFKAPRKLEEIQAEYQRLCLQAGHIQYQMSTLEKDLSLLNEQMRDLNLEGAAAQKAAAEAAAKEAKEENKDEKAS